MSHSLCFFFFFSLGYGIVVACTYPSKFKKSFFSPLIEKVQIQRLPLFPWIKSTTYSFFFSFGGEKRTWLPLGKKNNSKNIKMPSQRKQLICFDLLLISEMYRNNWMKISTKWDKNGTHLGQKFPKSIQLTTSL